MPGVFLLSFHGTFGLLPISFDLLILLAKHVLVGLRDESHGVQRVDGMDNQIDRRLNEN